MLHRLKATQNDGHTRLGDYMTPEVYDRFFAPQQREREAKDANTPKITLVPVNDAGEEIPWSAPEAVADLARRITGTTS